MSERSEQEIITEGQAYAARTRAFMGNVLLEGALTLGFGYSAVKGVGVFPPEADLALAGVTVSMGAVDVLRTMGSALRMFMTAGELVERREKAAKAQRQSSIESSTEQVSE